jgi:homoserine acetyltransferase
MMSGTEQRMAFAATAKDAVTEIDVLWITAGLGCDGDTIAMTAATQIVQGDFWNPGNLPENNILNAGLKVVRKSHASCGVTLHGMNAAVGRARSHRYNRPALGARRSIHSQVVMG